MFVLMWELYDEKKGWDQRTFNWFDTKEELLEAYRCACADFADDINSDRLLLSAAVNYSWADIERLF